MYVHIYTYVYICMFTYPHLLLLMLSCYHSITNARNKNSFSPVLSVSSCRYSHPSPSSQPSGSSVSSALCIDTATTQPRAELGPALRKLTAWQALKGSMPRIGSGLVNYVVLLK